MRLGTASSRSERRFIYASDSGLVVGTTVPANKSPYTQWTTFATLPGPVG